MATSAASPLAFWAFTALAGSVVVGLSALSYRFVEAPFMHGYGLKRVSTIESIPPVAAPQGLLDS
jgi:peptidoglycan/LPS O-acetylase OafA/YrhL